MTGLLHCRIFLWSPQFMGKSHYRNLELITCNNLDPNSWITFETAVKKRFCKQINWTNKIHSTVFSKWLLLILKCRTWLCIFQPTYQSPPFYWWLWCQCLHILQNCSTSFFKSKNKTSIPLCSFLPSIVLLQ